jgi:hypothetical protein
MSFGTAVNVGSGGGSSDSTTYTISTDTTVGGTPIGFQTRFVIENESIQANGLDFIIQIISSIDNFATFEVVQEFIEEISVGSATSVIVTTPLDNYPISTKFRVQYRIPQSNNTSNYNVKVYGLSSGTNTYFTSYQSYPPTTTELNGVNSLTSSYWSVGEYPTGNNFTVLTASSALTAIYGSGVIQSSSAAINAFGFSSIILPVSSISVGDYIRFEYNQDYVHNIVGITDTVNGNLALKVVPPIISGSILDHFVLYKVVNDGTYVMLDVSKNQSGSFTGILQPQYISQTLKDNYSNIIQDLTQKGLIS